MYQFANSCPNATTDALMLPHRDPPPSLDPSRSQISNFTSLIANGNYGPPPSFLSPPSTRTSQTSLNSQKCGSICSGMIIETPSEAILEHRWNFTSKHGPWHPVAATAPAEVCCLWIPFGNPTTTPVSNDDARDPISRCVKTRGRTSLIQIPDTPRAQTEGRRG